MLWLLVPVCLAFDVASLFLCFLHLFFLFVGVLPSSETSLQSEHSSHCIHYAANHQIHSFAGEDHHCARTFGIFPDFLFWTYLFSMHACVAHLCDNCDIYWTHFYHSSGKWPLRTSTMDSFVCYPQHTNIENEYLPFWNWINIMRNWALIASLH